MVEDIKCESIKKEEVIPAINVNVVRKKLEQYQNKVVNDVQNCLNRELEDLVQDLHQYELQVNEFQNFGHSDTWKNRKYMDKQQLTTETKEIKTTDAKTTNKPRTLPDKIFITRESYYTVLRGVNHMNVIFHLIYHLLFMFFLNDLCYNYFVHGVVRLGFGTFKAGLRDIHLVFGVWLLQHLFVFGLYYAFKCWASVHAKLQRQPPLQRFWSHSCLILHISAQVIFFYVPAALVPRLQLPYISAAVLLVENCRLLMKMHAFVRTNAGRLLTAKEKTDHDTPPPAVLAPFSKYFYFLFAPTLIYRDNYPRTYQIRWGFALKRLLEVVMVAFLYAFLYERYIVVYFDDFGKQPIAYTDLIVKLSGMIWPGILIFVCGNYMLLHAWMNFGAEVTRFGDRMFYKDWWTSNNYDAFYRNWNIVVYDWLYEYIYKESYHHLFKGSKVIASLMVFYASAIMHELLVGLALQLFFPVMFTFFGLIGVGFVFLTRHFKNFNNFFVWCSLIYGNGLMVFFYCIEYYARWNCPKTYNAWYDYFVPALFNCQYGTPS